MAENGMQQLATAISEQVGILTRHLQATGTPEPSYEKGVPPSFYSDPTVSAAHASLVELTLELHTLVQSPPALVLSSHHPGIILLPVIRLGIMKAISLDAEEVTIQEIAKATGLSEEYALRLLRYSVCHHIYAEPREGVFIHTAASRMLTASPSLQQFIRVSFEETLPAIYRISDAAEKWPNSEEPNHCGWNVANFTDKPFFETVESQPERVERFKEAMTFLSHMPGYSSTHLINDYPWKDLPQGATIVDIGGSHGNQAIAIAREAPHVKCIVQDRPEVISEGEKVLPEDVQGRVEFMEHDFFTEQPVHDADVYFFRMILHDWSDKYATKIVRSLLPALRPGSKVILHERLLPAYQAESLKQEKDERVFDLAMMAFQNAKERSLVDWQNLMTDIDPGFKLGHVKKSPEGQLYVIEFIFEGSGA